MKIFNHDKNPDSTEPFLWSSDPLSNYGFDEDMLSFYADGVAITLNEAGDSFNIKSARNENSIVNVDITRTAPGFQVGKNGTSFFGTDPAQPWGEMRHRFWPRCSVTGTITTKEKVYDFKGRGVLSHALQGMKPHHAAAKWNFVTFQTPTYSALMMEFTTPASYGSTVVNVGGVVKDGEILYAGATNTAKHLESKQDPVSDWPEPTSVEYEWKGKTKEGQDFSAILSGPLSERQDRIDVMAQVPGLIKSLAGVVVGTRPYIYQVYPPISIPIVLLPFITRTRTTDLRNQTVLFLPFLTSTPRAQDFTKRFRSRR